MNSLVKELYSITRKTKRIYPPHYWNKLGCKPQDFTNALCQVWNTFSNPHIRNNLVDLTGETEPFYYEVCNTPYKRGNYVVRENLLDWCVANQKENQHHSVFYHNQVWVDHIKSLGGESVAGVQNSVVGTDFLYLELDRKKQGLQKAIDDAIKIKVMFPYQDLIHLLYSGNNSIHIAVDMGLFGNPVGIQYKMCGRGKVFWNLAHKISGDVRYGNGIVDVYNTSKGDVIKSYVKEFDSLPENADKCKQDMENIDPNLFYVNSLVRSPYSWHEKGKKQKTLLDIQDLWSNSLSSNKRLTKATTKPYLLHWYYDCEEPTHKKSKKKVASNANSSDIEEVFDTIFEDFYPEDANYNGWINGLHSPFYDDSNPSVAVNVVTGQYKDYGLLEHNFTFEQLKQKFEVRPR